MLKPRRMEEIVRACSSVLSRPLTIKMRKGYFDDGDNAHTLLPHAASWGAAAATLHGRTRQQRYSRRADWEYIERCAAACGPSGLQLVGNGDVFSAAEYEEHVASGALATCMIGRGGLIKPWLFTARLLLPLAPPLSVFSLTRSSASGGPPVL